jgi:voltage-gated potassium channel
MSLDDTPPGTSDKTTAAPAPAMEAEGDRPVSVERAPKLQTPASVSLRSRSGGIRRVQKPRMTGLLDSPVHNLTFGVIYVVLVSVVGTIAYMKFGHWSFRDSIYMVITTVYTVGYGEVRPIDTPALNIITLSLIVFGCTGIIFLTGSLVQFIAVSQLTKVMGQKRMKTQIDQLSDHVIVCGFGRIGVALGQTLGAARAGFVVIEKDETRAHHARETGFLSIHGDAAAEAVLLTAGVMRARAMVTALQEDAVNVFITLSARALNPELLIIARGEEAGTEKKLLLAGANKVVLPTQIGAERIADLILFEESSRLIDNLEQTHGFQRALRTFGMELEVVTVVQNSTAVRMSVGAIERQARGTFFIVQINRADGDVHTDPPADIIVREGDGVVVIGRSTRSEAIAALFEPRRRAGVRS